MSGAKKKVTDPDTPDADQKTDAAEAKVETVKVKVNPALFNGGIGQVKLTVDGNKYTIGAKPVEVSRDLYEKLREQDVRGRQAVILD